LFVESDKTSKMKFEPRILFLITSIGCMLYLAKTLYEGSEINGTFWIAAFWVSIGIYLYRYPMKKES